MSGFVVKPLQDIRLSRTFLFYYWLFPMKNRSIMCSNLLTFTCLMQQKKYCNIVSIIWAISCVYFLHQQYKCRKEIPISKQDLFEIEKKCEFHWEFYILQCKPYLLFCGVSTKKKIAKIFLFKSNQFQVLFHIVM